MPVDGYISITVKDNLAKRLKDRADKNKRTIQQEIDFLLNSCGEG